MEFVLIRHSLTPGNLEKQYVGSTDQPLAPEGEALARERRERMPEVDGIWVSPLKRCRQTAELLFPGMVSTRRHRPPRRRKSSSATR